MKVHLDEPGSMLVRDAVGDAEVVATSSIAYVEARSAFARRRRAGDLSPTDYRRVVDDFETDWERYFILDVTQSLVREAGRLADKHRLRAHDAVHLAAARLAVERSESEIRLASWDVELERAAAAEGIVLLRRSGGRESR